MYNLRLIRLQALTQIVTIILIIVFWIGWGFSVLVYIPTSLFLVKSIF